MVNSMRTLTRQDWIAEGFDTLDREGYVGISAENLARRLNVTRGSFYHHFRNRDDYVQTLLSAWEDECAESINSGVADGLEAGKTLMRYLSLATKKKPGCEVAIRAWSLHDPMVAVFQQRVDAKRLTFAIETARRMVHLPGEAEVLGLAAHLCLIGGRQAGLRHDAERFNHFIQRAFSFVEKRHFHSFVK